MGRLAKSQTAIEQDEAVSPVEDVTRKVKPHVQLLLWARAAGHCQFEGCKLDVTEHHVSKIPGNYADKAHIVAFRKLGPRGNTLNRPEDVNSIENLMLLCLGCHRHIDRHVEENPRHKLEAMKRAHEDHVRAAMAQRPELGTHVVVLQIPIGGKAVQISDQHVREALLPKYPVTSTFHRIDLNGFAAQGESDEFYRTAAMQMAIEIDALSRPSRPLAEIKHASVFALAPIPLLVEFGARLSDKISADFFQRHQDTENWTWKTDPEPVRYTFKVLNQGEAGAPIALLLSLSGTVELKDLPPEFKNAALYELTLAGRTPSRTFLNTRADLANFRLAYIDALGEIAARHGVGEAISLIPAIPAPVAVICGRARHPKAHGPLRVFDMRRDKSGYIFRLEVTHGKA